MHCRAIAVTVTFAALLSAVLSVTAQTYPSKPIRFIIPFAAGGGNDIVSRVICSHLTEAFGQQVVPDNRAGAGGIIGTQMVAESAPDGYTLGMGSTSTFAINPALMKKLPYDPIRDFAPVTLTVSNAYVLVAHPSLPVRTVKELIALAKARPGALNFPSAGNGTTLHLAGEIFKTMAGVDMVHVPYKGSGPAMVDMLGGHVHLAFSPMTQVLQPARSGRLRLLGITSLKRSVVIPEVPTLDESGVRGYNVVGWFGVVAPAGTPKPVVDKLHQAIVRILNSPAVDRLVKEGAEIGGTTPEQFAAYIKAELGKWGKAVRDAKVPMR